VSATDRLLDGSSRWRRPGTRAPAARTYDGLFLPQIDIDLDKLMDRHGASFRVSMIQAHGPSMTEGRVGNLMNVS
jgi:carbohydrate-selective porin OprB